MRAPIEIADSNLATDHSDVSATCNGATADRNFASADCSGASTDRSGASADRNHGRCIHLACVGLPTSVSSDMHCLSDLPDDSRSILYIRAGDIDVTMSWLLMLHAF